MKILTERAVIIRASLDDLMQTYLDKLCDDLEHYWNSMTSELVVTIQNENPEERAEVLKRRMYIEGSR